MKWENFKLMSKEHREEYSYRFGKKPEAPNFVGPSVLLLSWFFVLMAFTFTTFFVPSLEPYKENVFDWFTYGSRTLAMVQIVIAIQLFVYLGQFIHYERNRRKWLKERGYNK